MNNYRIIPRNIAGRLTLEETYVYICLCFRSDFKSGESHVLRKTLCDLSLVKKEDTITAYTNRFQELGLLTKYHETTKVSGIKTHTRYHVKIPTADWIRVDESILTDGHSRELKAFLVLLKCLCMNNTNTTMYNKTEIAEKLKMDRKTVAKYLSQAIDCGSILENDRCYFISENYILFDLPDVKKEILKEKYQIIADYCKKQGVVPPPFDLKLMETLVLYRYCVSEEDLKSRNERNYKYFSLSYNLPRLCEKLPEQIHSLNYFLCSLVNTKAFHKWSRQEVIIPEKDYLIL